MLNISSSYVLYAIPYAFADGSPLLLQETELGLGQIEQLFNNNLTNLIINNKPKIINMHFL